MQNVKMISNALNTVWGILNEVNVWSVAFRIFLAVLIGGIIGMDRGRHGRAAGARTHILVCLGSAVTTLLGFYTASCLGFANDPLRMGAQVVSGIGFLGVGTIMIRNQSEVKGLTTAAGLWATACIGLAIGAGFYALAVIAFLAVLLTFTLLSRLERRWGKRASGSYYIEVNDITTAKELYVELIDRVAGIDIVPARSGLPEHVGMELVAEDGKEGRALLASLQHREEVALAIPYHH